MTDPSDAVPVPSRFSGPPPHFHAADPGDGQEPIDLDQLVAGMSADACREALRDLLGAMYSDQPDAAFRIAAYLLRTG